MKFVWSCAYTLSLLSGMVPVGLVAQSGQNGVASATAPQWTQEVTYPALAIRAPGAPGYGLQIATSMGKIMITNLYIDPANKKPSVTAYRIGGPAGLGPYRAGIAISLSPKTDTPANRLFAVQYYDNNFNINEVAKGSAAEKAGLEKDKYGARKIISVDGSNFGWDIGSLVYYITNHPEIKIETEKFSIWFSNSVSYQTYKVKNVKLQTPADPADGTFENLPPNRIDKTTRAWLDDRHTWEDLLVLRSKQARFMPLPFDLNGKKAWAVYSSTSGSDNLTRRYVEIWMGDPAKGFGSASILDVWPAPEGGMQTGMVLRIGTSWYQLKSFGVNSANEQLTQFETPPWKADVEALFEGKSLADKLGDVNLLDARESLESLANDQLIEWKTLTLPGLLAKSSTEELQDRVIRMEKGLLALDLKVRHLHTLADAQAQVKVEQAANSQMPGAQASQPALYTTSSAQESLIDILSQRQAILQAILGSVKQALAQTRR